MSRLAPLLRTLPVVFAVLLATGASAQTFRGLTLGMPADALDALPAPYSENDMGDGATSFQWDLQNDQALSAVTDAEGQIVMLNAYDYAPRGQIQFEQTPASEVQAILGSPGGYFGSNAVSGLSDIAIWRAVWPLDDQGSAYMIIEFRGPWNRETDDDRQDPPLPVPDEAVVRNITLVQDDARQYGRFMDGDFIPREGTAPLALPLSELFVQ